MADLQRRAGQAQAQVEEQRRKMGGLRAAQDCDIQVCTYLLLPEPVRSSPQSASKPFPLHLSRQWSEEIRAADSHFSGNKIGIS